MDNKPNNFKKNNSSNEIFMKSIPFLLVVIIILLLLIFLKLDKMNKNFVILASSGTVEVSTTNEKYDEVLDVFFETTEEIGDSLPLHDEISDTSTSTTTEEFDKKTTEAKNETTSSSSISSAKTTYVINKNSKKMHFKTCSFVDRMKEENKAIVQLDKQELNGYLNSGYSFCSSCGG